MPRYTFVAAPVTTFSWNGSVKQARIRGARAKSGFGPSHAVIRGAAKAAMNPIMKPVSRLI